MTVVRFHRTAGGEVRRCDGQGCDVCDPRPRLVALAFFTEWMRYASTLVETSDDPWRVTNATPWADAPSVPMPAVCKITRLAPQTETRHGVTRLVGERTSEQVWGRRWTRQKRSLPVLIELPGGRVHTLHTSFDEPCEAVANGRRVTKRAVWCPIAES